jgi:hypothetical protein
MLTSARRHVRSGALLFAAILAVLLTWVVGMPRYSQPDEYAHMIKMYATAHGDAAGSPTSGASAVFRTMTAPASLVSGSPECYVFQPDVSAGCAVPDNDSTLGPRQTWVGTYPPWYYGLVGVPARLIGEDASVLASRAISAVFCAVLLALALGIFRRRAGHAGAIAVVVLTPMTLAISAAVNPSGFEICGAFLFWSLLTSIALGPEAQQRRIRTWAGVVAAVVVLVRPDALPWMLAGFVAIGIVEWRQFSDRREHARLWAPAMTMLAAATLASGLWGRYAHSPLSDSRAHEDWSVGSMIRVGLGRTMLIGRSAFGILGWADTELPSLALLLWIGSVGLLIAVVWLAGPSRPRSILLGLAVLWVCLPVAYTTAVRTPENWAGRYSLPLLGGLAFVALLVLPKALGVEATRRVSRFVGLAFLVIEVISFHQALRRFMVGASGSITLSDPGWHPPVNAWLLVLCNAAATALVVAVMLRPSGASAVLDHEPQSGVVLPTSGGRSTADPVPSVRLKRLLGHT